MGRTGTGTSWHRQSEEGRSRKTVFLQLAIEDTDGDAACRGAPRSTHRILRSPGLHCPCRPQGGVGETLLPQSSLENHSTEIIFQQGASASLAQPELSNNLRRGAVLMS
ncbi:hypothetical protein GN956_G17733 [Arapaima gigas]